MLRPEFNITDPIIYHVPTANPVELCRRMSQSVPYWISRFRKIRPYYTIPHSLLQDLSGIRLGWFELLVVCGLSLVLHFVRMRITIATSRWVSRNHIYPRYSQKLPETVWKLSFYGISWFFSLMLHTMCEDINSFGDPLSIWKGWSSGISPPMHPAVLVVYSIQAAFYFHSIYATLYLDIWRKDSWIMFVHHFIALALLLLSYIDNFTLCGAFIVFLQDSSDAMLEMAKVGMYIRKRTNGAYFGWVDNIGSIIFVLFAVNWVICRLYWYPCKFLYATVYGAVYLGPQDAPFFPILGLLLILIYIMNIYWFSFIARMLWRVARTGEEPEDNREWDTTAVTGLSKKSLDEMANRKID